MRQFLVSLTVQHPSQLPVPIADVVQQALLEGMASGDDDSQPVSHIAVEEIDRNSPNGTVDTLESAESFIAGFEDDDIQEGIDDLLESLHGAIVRERARPVLLDSLKGLRAAATGFRDDAYRREPHLRIGSEATNMLSAFLLDAERSIALAEGRSHG
ncbi:hypothetical protein [Tianweitania sediminis]|uniref:Uncharacterized protein n=1 Tax=Tianweitania sediminis TaxID=1502156 RepID=A0A8J7UJW0_9HYPH|nr:hypothetical protein [Tianweitania sediminis]MBP0440463.1 hypothetical protein [Tianweitania sediminis]